MRVIAGTLRGRTIAGPGGRTRPTADRLREAWFAILGSQVRGARVLDLFAGSGALGIEALSRGAAHVTFVELAGTALQILRENLETLGLVERVNVRRADALRFVAKLAARSYDVAFADPPYSTRQAERLVTLYRAVPFARVLGVEHAAATTLTGDDVRRYGNVALTFCYAP